jgi:hypothetical protein
LLLPADAVDDGNVDNHGESKGGFVRREAKELDRKQKLSEQGSAASNALDTRGGGQSDG